MADRSTAAVGVANEGGATPSAAQEDGATSDGTTTDDRTGGTAGDDAKDASSQPRTTTIERPTETTQQAHAPEPSGKKSATDTASGTSAEPAADATDAATDAATDTTAETEVLDPAEAQTARIDPTEAETAVMGNTVAETAVLETQPGTQPDAEPDSAQEAAQPDGGDSTADVSALDTVEAPMAFIDDVPGNTAEIPKTAGANGSQSGTARPAETAAKSPRKPAGGNGQRAGGKTAEAAPKAAGTASKPVPAEPAGTTDGKSAGKPTAEPADKPSAKADGKPGAKAGEKPTGTAAAEPAPADAPAGKTATGPTDKPTDKPAAKATDKAGEKPAAAKPAARPKLSAPELHSGHKLARRYQLAECVTRVDGFSSWRAVDEKLRRAVGIHVLPADHPRARAVLAAARAAALLGDPRFVQVLDAVEEDDLVYVIHEWLPDAASLADLLATSALDPYEAYQMVSQVSQAMAAAHREGLAHLRLDPGAVLRTVSGQYRIRGLAVAAALRGLSSDHPQRQDTESIGALLYASLTQRWPYEDDAHGLAGLPKGVGLVAPDQVRAGVHRGLSEIAMRALANDGATASREDPPCTTPEELAKAVAALPRIRPVDVHTPPAYRVPAYQQPPQPPGVPTRQPVAPPPPPPALPGRTGQFLKGVVATLLIVAIGLGSWQLADALKSRGGHSANRTPNGQKSGQHTSAPPAAHAIRIVTAKDFDPLGDGSENSELVPKAYDGNPSTYWQTSSYTKADFGGLKPGVGLILDLGSAQRVTSVSVDFIGNTTSVDLMAAGRDATSMPSRLDDFTKVASATGAKVKLTPSSQLTARFLLVWLTKLPQTSSGSLPFRGSISEIDVTG